MAMQNLRTGKDMSRCNVLDACEEERDIAMSVMRQRSHKGGRPSLLVTHPGLPTALSEVLPHLQSGEMSQRQCASILGISVRSMNRYLRYFCYKTYTSIQADLLSRRRDASNTWRPKISRSPAEISKASVTITGTSYFNMFCICCSPNGS